MGSLPKEPWNHSPWFHGAESYKHCLIGYEIHKGHPDLNEFSDFSSLAEEWLIRLDPYPSELQREPGHTTHPVRLDESGHKLWLHFNGSRSKFGYRNIEVSTEPPRTDKAILAAVTALEGEQVATEELRKGLPNLAPLLTTPPSQNTIYGCLVDAMKGDSRAIQEMPGDDLEKALEWVKEHGSIADGRVLGQIAYVLYLLKHHRPGFDDLPYEEKLSYIEHASARVNEYLGALQNLVAFLERGTPDGKIPPPKKLAQRNVTAAVLSDVAGLSTLEIAEEFGEPVPEKYKEKREHPTVRLSWVKPGRETLEKALGKEGWLAKAKTMKAEAERWRSLSEEERRVEHVADLFSMTVEEAHGFIDRERASVEGQVPNFL